METADSPLREQASTGLQAGPPSRLMACAVRGPGLDGLRTWLGALPSPSEVLNFLTRGPTFSFCAQPPDCTARPHSTPMTV